MSYDVGRRLFRKEINLEPRFLGQPRLLSDISRELRHVAQVFWGGLHTQLTPQDHVCLSIILQATNIGRNKGSILPPDGGRCGLGHSPSGEIGIAASGRSWTDRRGRPVV